MMEQERWLPAIGYVGYEVSDHGRVRSLDRILRCPHFDKFAKILVMTDRRRRGQILRPGTVKSGHQLVVLGKGNSVFVHKLVLEAFVGTAPEGHECCHWDDDPSNNHLGNLRWGTRTDNMADYVRNYGHRQSARYSNA
jgi:hypothetical protein